MAVAYIYAINKIPVRSRTSDKRFLCSFYFWYFLKQDFGGGEPLLCAKQVLSVVACKIPTIDAL